MKAIQISDDIYDKLKGYVVDPFEDTPEFVVRRLIEIADKAKDKWCSWDDPAEDASEPAEDGPEGAETKPLQNWKQQAEPVL